MPLTPTVTANIWMRCQNACPYCVAHVQDRSSDRFDDGRDFGEVLDVFALLRWLDRFRPPARLHISGGEPLLFDGIEDWIETAVKAGRKITILTNGQLIHKRPRLHNLPINWIVTYHKLTNIDPDEYAKNLECIKNKNVEIRTIIQREDYDTEAEYVDELKSTFEGFLFRPRYASFENKTARIWEIPKLEECDYIASRTLTLIENNGKVYPCNSKHIGPIGDVYAMTCDEFLSAKCDSASKICAERQQCGALNTAIWEQHLEQKGVWK
jgi:organic radical activating enzyme